MCVEGDRKENFVGMLLCSVYWDVTVGDYKPHYYK